MSNGGGATSTSFTFIAFAAAITAEAISGWALLSIQPVDIAIARIGCSRFTVTGSRAVIGSRSSYPAIVEKRSAQSSALRASGPMWAGECESGIAPWRETRPQVVFKPVTPHADAGRRTEPPVSDPSAPKTKRAPTAPPEPLDEPPVMYAGFHGLQQSPQ